MGDLSELGEIANQVLGQGSAAQMLLLGILAVGTVAACKSAGVPGRWLPLLSIGVGVGLMLLYLSAPWTLIGIGAGLVGSALVDRVRAAQGAAPAPADPIPGDGAADIDALFAPYIPPPPPPLTSAQVDADGEAAFGDMPGYRVWRLDRGTYVAPAEMPDPVEVARQLVSQAAAAMAEAGEDAGDGWIDELGYEAGQLPAADSLPGPAAPEAGAGGDQPELHGR